MQHISTNIASRLEAIALRLRLEGIALDLRLEAVTIRFPRILFGSTVSNLSADQRSAAFFRAAQASTNLAQENAFDKNPWSPHDFPTRPELEEEFHAAMSVAL